MGNPPELDRTPLDTDWDDVHELWEDVRRFARDNPDHRVLAADDPGCNHDPPRVPRMGWTAFREGEEDEAARSWTITLANLKNSAPRLYAREEVLEFRRLLRTAAGRRTLAELVSEAGGRS